MSQQTIDVTPAERQDLYARALLDLRDLDEIEGFLEQGKPKPAMGIRTKAERVFRILDVLGWDPKEPAESLTIDADARKWIAYWAKDARLVETEPANYHPAAKRAQYAALLNTCERILAVA